MSLHCSYESFLCGVLMVDICRGWRWTTGTELCEIFMALQLLLNFVLLVRDIIDTHSYQVDSQIILLSGLTITEVWECTEKQKP